ncbi:hypothetical protein Tco_0854446 [Tanacetum coccineum]
MYNNINNISTFQKQEHRHIHSFISHTQRSKIHFRNSDKSKNFLKSSSCLKINLAKCQLFGIGVPLADVESIARSLNCSFSSLPFNYLGHPVGKDMRKIEAWDEVVNRFSKRLSMWKAMLLSVGGRLTLVKAGMNEGEKKIYWVGWNKVILDKEDGGLGIGNLKAKNLGLLENGNGDFFNDSDALWCKVISEIHGSKEGFDVSDISSANSGVWVSLVKCCSNLNRFGIDLNEIMVRNICDGRNTLFWLHIWIKGCGPLKDRFPRLFVSEQHKSCSVAERWAFSNGAWRRQPTRMNGFGTSKLQRVALDRLPTIENLSRRGLLHLDSSSCLFCESEVETKDHYNILHGIPSLYANKWKAKLFHAICLGFIWSVWAWRNRILHASSDEEKSCALHEDIFPAVQRILLLRTSNRASKNRFSWANWILRPNELLDS